MLPEAKKYWKRVLVIIGFVILGSIPLLLSSNADNFGLGTILAPIIILLGAIFIFQTSYALYYTFKPKVDLLSPSAKPFVNAFLTVGIWFVIAVIILILHSIFRAG